MTIDAPKTGKSPRCARRPLWALAAVILSGCVLSPAPPNEGQLGSDTFFYTCVLEADAACNLVSSSKPLDKIPVIALGSTFGIVAEPLGDTVISPTPFIEQRSVGSTGSVFIAKRAGDAVLISQSNSVSKNTVEATDLTHVHIHAPTTLALSSGDVSPGFTALDPSAVFMLTKGSTVKVRVVSQDQAGVALGGALLCQWTSSDPAVVALGSDPTANIVQLSGMTAGMSTVKVTYGELNVSFNVTVSP
jgi:hypothetical protein